MKRLMNWAWIAAAFLFASAALAQAPYPEERPARRAFSQAELDQVLAPIALYPDSLLSQILMASTYPRDLAEAASWSRRNRGIRGEAAVRAAEGRDWDPSVISLVAFPEILAMMDERRDWTERIAQAYLEQPEDVMDSVQHLRRRADEAGSLKSSEEIVVHREGDHYTIDTPSPEIVYVPYYDPRVVYGAWWWPSYEPVWWRPWPGWRYRYGYRGYAWGPSIFVGPSFFYGSIDWHDRHLRWSHHRPWYYRGDHWHRGDRWVRDPRRGDWHWHGDRHRWRDGDRDRRRDGDRDRWRDRDHDHGGDRDRGGHRDRDRDRRRDDRRGTGGTAPQGTQPDVAKPVGPGGSPLHRYPQVSPGSPVYRADPDTRERQRAPVVRTPQALPQAARPAPVQQGGEYRSGPPVAKPVPANPTARVPVEGAKPVERAEKPAQESARGGGGEKR